jgi:hypothetical protein
VKYELRFYIPEDYIIHSHRRENLKSFEAALGRHEVKGDQRNWNNCITDEALEVTKQCNIPEC